MARQKSSDLVGNKIHYLFVESVYTLDGKCYANCTCQCGNSKSIRIDSIRTGRIKSCGCKKRQHLIDMNTKHNMCGSREYSSWQHMKNRCKPENSESFPYHAGKGISICDEWLESFEKFYEDMGECPENYTLDRIDGSEGYFKDNCRWAPNTLQAFNKNPNKISGVHYRKERKSWYAEIHKDGVRYYLGSYKTKEDAIKARLEAGLEFYGENSAKNLILNRDV